MKRKRSLRNNVTIKTNEKAGKHDRPNNGGQSQMPQMLTKINLDKRKKSI